ncbi:MAG: zinc ribbon domain-containing protein [Pyrinomonadaceae bacterium]
MTPTTATEDLVCSACGAEIRTDADYCYNCGGFVGDEPAPNSKPRNENGLHLPEKLEGHGRASVSSAASLPKLRSAAALRRQSKIIEKKPVEVVWEAKEDTLDFKLLAVTGIILLFAILVVAMRNYLN